MSLGIWTGVALLESGGVAAGATVEVRRESDNGLAALFSTRAGTAGTEIVNPSAFADSNGRIKFYTLGTVQGVSIKVTSGAFTYTLHNQPVGLAREMDADSFWTGVLAATSETAARLALGFAAIAAKGDTFFGSAADTIVKKAAPANGHIRVANSAEADGWQDVPALFRQLGGLETSNNVTDPTNDIDIAVGGTLDTTGAFWMALTAALTKQIDASWAVGNNQGGLDGTESVAGTPDNDTWYYLWLIQRSDTGVVDALFSESATAPTMPTNYDRKQLIGTVRRGTATNLAYYQDKDTFKFQQEKQVLTSGTATVETAVNISSAVPSVAVSFFAKAEITAGIGTGVSGTHNLEIFLETGVAWGNMIGQRHNSSGSETHRHSSAEVEFYNTGTFNYRNVQSNTTSRDTNIAITGFKLARGTA
jgi:hypothetical protein